MKKIFGLCALLLTTACISGGNTTPITSYTLKPLTETKSIIDANKEITIGITEVKIPEYIDRPHIVLLEDDNISVKKSEFNRWIESPSGLIQRTIANDISIYLPKSIVKPKNFMNETFDFTIYLEINQFDGTFNNQANLNIWWTIFDKDDHMVFKKQSILHKDIGNTYKDYAIAQSDLIAKLSKEIAEELNRLYKPQL